MSFLFRCRENFCLETIEFAKSGKKDGIIKIDMNRSNRKYQKSVKTKSVFEADDDSIVNVPDMICVRCVRIERGNKAPMFLLTNIPKEELSYEQIGEAYNMRWGTETSFDLDKNTLEVENFSSKTPNGVLQEFHAKTLTANIAELLVCQAQKELDTEQKEKNNRNSYLINRNVAYGLVKNEIVILLNNIERANLWFEKMTKKVMRYRVAIKPNRSFPKKRKYKTKFSMNRRRST